MIEALGQIAPPDSGVNDVSGTGLPQRVLQAIKNAAVRTGVDFSYLVNKASQESGFDPNAKSSASSATGLYQFTSQTWLQMVKEHGANYGLGNYANQITMDHNGVAHVGNAAARQSILALRHDPQISAEMAGELDKDNLGALQQNVSGKIGGTELYLAHFLGAGGASDFLNKMRADPGAKAADILPQAASANPAVFYGSNGQARSLAQIYKHFAQKFDSHAPAATLVASTQPTLPAPGAIMMAAPMTVASAADPLPYNPLTPPSGTPGGSFAAASIGNSARASGSSLFATMVLAQMDNGHMDQLLSTPSLSLNHEKKNSQGNAASANGISMG